MTDLIPITMSEVEQDILNSDGLSESFQEELPEEPPQQLMMPKRALTGPTGSREVRGLQEQQLRQGQLLLVSLLEVLIESRGSLKIQISHGGYCTELLLSLRAVSGEELSALS